MVWCGMGAKRVGNPHGHICGRPGTRGGNISTGRKQEGRGGVILASKLGAWVTKVPDYRPAEAGTAKPNAVLYDDNRNLTANESALNVTATPTKDETRNTKHEKK